MFTIHELTSKVKNCTEGKNKVKIIGIGGLVTVMITIAICGTIFGTLTNKGYGLFSLIKTFTNF